MRGRDFNWKKNQHIWKGLKYKSSELRTNLTGWTSVRVIRLVENDYSNKASRGTLLFERKMNKILLLRYIESIFILFFCPAFLSLLHFDYELQRISSCDFSALVNYKFVSQPSSTKELSLIVECWNDRIDRLWHLLMKPSAVRV